MAFGVGASTCWPMCGAHAISRIISRVRASPAACPIRDRPSARIHSRVRACRFPCANAACRRIFAERLPSERGPRAQRTARLSNIHRHVGLAFGGAPGARLANRLGMPASRDTQNLALAA